MPFKYNDDDKQRIADHVIEQCATGRALSRVLKDDDGMCTVPTFLEWCENDSALLNKVTRAREHGVEVLLDETLEIADETNADAYIETAADGTQRAKIDGEAIQRSKLRVLTRQQYASMIAPRKYGNRLDLTSGGEKLEAPQVNQVTLVDARVQSLIAIAMQRREEEQVLLQDLME